jgi:hypothetical protein
MSESGLYVFYAPSGLFLRRPLVNALLTGVVRLEAALGPIRSLPFGTTLGRV